MTDSEDNKSTDMQKLLIKEIVQEVGKGPVGWSCPKCGAGIAPFLSKCPCVPFKLEVTC